MIYQCIEEFHMICHDNYTKTIGKPCKLSTHTRPLNILITVTSVKHLSTLLYSMNAKTHHPMFRIILALSQRSLPSTMASETLDPPNSI